MGDVDRRGIFQVQIWAEREFIFIAINDLITCSGYSLVSRMNLILSSSDGNLSENRWQELGKLMPGLSKIGELMSGFDNA